MNYRKFGFLLVLVPGLAVAQQGVAATSPLSLGEGPGVRTNATTLAVLRANCPKDMPMADWLKLMANPVNAVIYPLHITQEMLDTLDGRELDLRYRYVLVKTVAAWSTARATNTTK